jgi:hypothetical protein
MESLRATSRSVAYDDLCAIGLSGMDDALRELEDAGLVHSWGGGYVVYYDMLWLD